MKISTVYQYRGVLRAPNGEVLQEKGYFTMHAARRAMVQACVAAGEDGHVGVTAEIYRGEQKVSDFSILDQGAA